MDCRPNAAETTLMNHARSGYSSGHYPTTVSCSAQLLHSTDLSANNLAMGNVTSVKTPDTYDDETVQLVQANFDRLVVAMKQVVAEVARKAYERNLITRQSLAHAENLLLPTDHRSSALLIHIQDKIEENEMNFHEFISILQDVPVLKELANEMISTTAKVRSQVKSKNGIGKKKLIVARKSNGPANHEVSSSFSEVSAVASQSGTSDSSQSRLSSCDYPTATSYTYVHSSNSDVSGSSASACRYIRNTGISLLRPPATANSMLSGLSGETEESILSTNSSCKEGSGPHFQCRCGKNCTLDSFVKGKCHQQSYEMFPCLKLDHLNNNDKEKLVRKLTSEAKQMVEIFADLVVTTFKSLEEQGISVEMLRADTITFGQQKLPKPYSDDHIQQLASARTVRDIQIFLVGYRYISFFNYGILQKMIRFHGTEMDKSNLDEYLDKYSSFCKRSVFEIPSTMIDKLSPEIKETLVIKVIERQWFSSQGQKNSEVFTMEDLYAVEESIGKLIGLESTYILLRDVKQGCVKLTFSFASDIAVLPLILAQQQKLSSLGIRILVNDSNCNSCVCLSSLPQSESTRGLQSQFGVPYDTGKSCSEHSTSPQHYTQCIQDSAKHTTSQLTVILESGHSQVMASPVIRPSHLTLSDRSSGYGSLSFNDASSMSTIDSPAMPEASTFSSVTTLNGSESTVFSQCSPIHHEPFSSEVSQCPVSEPTAFAILEYLSHQNCKIPQCRCHFLQEKFHQLLNIALESSNFICSASEQDSVSCKTTLMRSSQSPKAAVSLQSDSSGYESQCGTDSDAHITNNYSAHYTVKARNTRYFPRPPALLRELSQSSDNLPALCLNNYSPVPETPAIVRCNQSRSLSYSVHSSRTHRSKSLSDLTPIPEVSETGGNFSSLSNLTPITDDSTTPVAIDYSYDADSDSDDGYHDVSLETNVHKFRLTTSRNAHKFKTQGETVSIHQSGGSNTKLVDAMKFEHAQRCIRVLTPYETDVRCENGVTVLTTEC